MWSKMGIKNHKILKNRRLPACYVESNVGKGQNDFVRVVSSC